VNSIGGGVAGDEDGDCTIGSGDTLVNADRATGCEVVVGGRRGLRLLRSSGAIKNATSKLRFCAGLWCSATAGNDVTCCATASMQTAGGEYREGGEDDAVVTFR